MKRIYLLVLVLTTLFLSSGCNWLVPNAIKRETSLMKVDVNTCLKEIKEIEEDKNKTETEKLKESNYKMKKTLSRIKPHIENFNNYVHGNQSEE